jgi:hypothetical protein
LSYCLGWGGKTRVKLGMWGKDKSLAWDGGERAGQEEMRENVNLVRRQTGRQSVAQDGRKTETDDEREDRSLKPYDMQGECGRRRNHSL